MAFSTFENVLKSWFKSINGASERTRKAAVTVISFSRHYCSFGITAQRCDRATSETYAYEVPEDIQYRVVSSADARNSEGQ